MKFAISECKSKFGDIEVEVGLSGDREFVNAYLDTEPNHFGSSFRDAFYQHTEGHSLFTVEMLRGLKEQLFQLEGDDQTFFTDSLNELGIVPELDVIYENLESVANQGASSSTPE